jgi:hypothetical protein
VQGVLAGGRVAASLLGAAEVEQVVCLRGFEAKASGRVGGVGEVHGGVAVPVFGPSELPEEALGMGKGPLVAQRSQQTQRMVACRLSRSCVTGGDQRPRRQQPAGTFLPDQAEPVQVGAAGLEKLEGVGGATALGVDERQV